MPGDKFYDCITAIYQFIKPFLGNKMYSFEEYGASSLRAEIDQADDISSSSCLLRAYKVIWELGPLAAAVRNHRILGH